MSAVTNYTPIRIGRSDGELHIKTPKHGREPNGPSTDQLDRVANPDDYYEELDPDHPIALEWKRQLGRMLQIEHDGASKKSSEQGKWFLVFFPENYRLYRHITASEKAKSNRKVERKGEQDDGSGEAYLYGYPLGRKKRYRTAKEFFPHLMWLAEDKSEEYGDCTCKHCAPDWVQKVEPLPGREGFVPAGVSAGANLKREALKKESTTIKKENPALKKDIAQIRRDAIPPRQQQPKVVIPARPVSQETTTTIKAPSKSQVPANTARPSAPPAPTPTPLAVPRSAEQAADFLPNRYLYRPGEVTWFNRGTAWGLAVVLSRSLFTHPTTGKQNQPRYIMQPLSHPFSHPPVKELDTEDDLRPWLAWSAPGATHASLASPPGNYAYATIPWKEVAEGRFGPGDAEVDGSIFAAKMIDDSFTLLEPLRNDAAFMTTGERSYNAMYLGGEKIWAGEPVRLRAGGGQDVMVVSSVMEKLKPGSTDAMKATVWVVGDVLRWTIVPAAQEMGGGIPSPGHLPLRMREDLAFRNGITRAKKQVVGYWKLLSPGQRMNISEVKGRWYESSILLPVLKGQQIYAAEVARGEISDVGNWINGRQDANLAAGQIGTRKADRVEAFGKAVPEGTRVGTGPEIVGQKGSLPSTPAPPTAAQFTAVPGSISSGDGARMAISGEVGKARGVSDGDIAEFMDLDRMEDGFARDFAAAGGGRI